MTATAPGPGAGGSAGGSRPVVGVLALQGDVREHERVLTALGAEVRQVRRPEELEGLDAIVLPGGESTTMSLLLQSSGLLDALQLQLDKGLPALGTCAGMILLASDILDGRPDQRCFSAIDLAVRRNAFGRQVESFEADLDVAGLDRPMHAVFIRAPLVESYGEEVEVLASVRRGDGVTRPVVCRQDHVLVAAFHPELSGDDRLHRLLLELVGQRA